MPNKFNHGQPGVYNNTALSLNDGDGAGLALDSRGIAKTNPAYLQAGEDLTNDVTKVEQRFSPRYISTATTTVVKSGSGFLHTITVSGGTAGIITVYDNTAASGTVIVAFASTNALNTYIFNETFGTGLTIVTAAATQINISYR